MQKDDHMPKLHLDFLHAELIVARSTLRAAESVLQEAREDFCGFRPGAKITYIRKTGSFAEPIRKVTEALVRNISFAPDHTVNKLRLQLYKKDGDLGRNITTEYIMFSRAESAWADWARNRQFTILENPERKVADDPSES